jgi:deoxyribonuclease-4
VRFGLHIPVAGGLDAAADRLRALSCECAQLFAGNPRAWAAGRFDHEAAAGFRTRLRKEGVRPLFVHASYLVNLAAPDDAIYAKSIDAICGDLERAEALGAAAVVLHAGSARDRGPEWGVARLVAGLDAICRRCPSRVQLALENAAGAGGAMGGRWEQFAEVIDRVQAPERIRIAFDTCHAHVAGYDLSTEEGVEKTVRAIRRTIGLRRLVLIHANDARWAAGSHRDAHQHIGRGTIGKAGFQALLQHPALQRLPFILETPKDTPTADARNLRLLRRLADHGCQTTRQVVSSGL